MTKAPVIQEKSPEAALATDGPVCQHHWLIESPRGATSPGRCKRCGAERQFRNSATDYLWEDESSSGYNAWRGVRAARRETSDEEEVSAGASGGASVLLV